MPRIRLPTTRVHTSRCGSSVLGCTPLLNVVVTESRLCATVPALTTTTAAGGGVWRQRARGVSRLSPAPLSTSMVPHLYTVSRRGYATTGSTTTTPAPTYAEAVNCDVYAYDTAPLRQATIAGQALPGHAASLPPTANVAVLCAFTAEKHRLTSRMKLILKELIEAHVAQWTRQQQQQQQQHDPHSSTSHEHHNSSSSSTSREASLPLLIVSVSNGGLRQAQKDQKKLDAFLASLPAALRPPGAVFLCAMTTAQGGALGGPFAKPSRRVAASASARNAHAHQPSADHTHPAQQQNASQDVTNAADEDDAPAVDEREEEEEPVEATNSNGDGTQAPRQAHGDAADDDASPDPFLDALDVDPTAITDLEAAEKDAATSLDDDVDDAEVALEEEPSASSPPPPQKKGKKGKKGGDASQSASKIVQREPEEDSGTPDSDVDFSESAAQEDTSVPQNEHFDDAPTRTALDNEDAPPVSTRSSASHSQSQVVPQLHGACTTAQRFTGVKTVYLSDVLHQVVPAVANVMVIDRRTVWQTATSAVNEKSNTDKVREGVEQALRGSEDDTFGPLLVHPGAYALTANIVCDHNTVKTAWLPTLLVFQTNWLAAEAAVAQHVLGSALRRVQHVEGRLGAVFVVGRDGSEAAVAALSKAATECQQRSVPSYRPTITEDQDSPFSNVLSRTFEAVGSAVAQHTAETDTPPSRATTGKAEPAAERPRVASIASALSDDVTIKLPELGLFTWGGAKDKHTITSSRDDDDDATQQPAPEESLSAHVSPPMRHSKSKRRRLVRPKRISVRGTQSSSKSSILGPGFVTVWIPTAAARDEATVAPEEQEEEPQQEQQGNQEENVEEAVTAPSQPSPPTAEEEPTSVVETVADSAAPNEIVSSSTPTAAEPAVIKRAPAHRAKRHAQAIDDDALIDAAVAAVLRGMALASPSPSAAVAAADSTSPAPSPSSSASRPSLVSVIVTKPPVGAAKRTSAAARRREAAAVTSATSTDTSNRAAQESPAATPKVKQDVDFDALVAAILKDADASAQHGKTSSPRTTQRTTGKTPHSSHTSYSWEAATAVTTPKRRRPAQSKAQGKASTKKAPLSKAHAARVAKANQARAAASRRRLKAAAAAVDQAKTAHDAPPGSRRRGGTGRAATLNPAFALPSPEHYVFRASQAELKALHQIMEPRVMPKEKDLAAVPQPQAARFSRAVSVYPGVNCHGNTKEKIQMLTWFPSERFKETYRKVSSSTRTTPCTVVLMAQRVTSPKLFVSQAQEDELVVRTVGAIVYACAKNEAMHPKRRHRIARGRILCFIFRNDLTLHACEKQQEVLEKVLHTIKGFERAKVMVATPLPSTKKRVVA